VSAPLGSSQAQRPAVAPFPSLAWATELVQLSGKLPLSCPSPSLSEVGRIEP
jgi:hypothetical protein